MQKIKIKYNFQYSKIKNSIDKTKQPIKQSGRDDYKLEGRSKFFKAEEQRKI